LEDVCQQSLRLELEHLQNTDSPVFKLPEEIYLQIFSYLHPFDLWNLEKTCEYFARLSSSELVWKRQWNKLVDEAPFIFPATQALEDLGICFKDSCRRLLITLCCQGTNYTKCVYCKECTCRSACLRLRGDKIVLDIGGKMTWLLTGDFSLRKHLSMIAVPKLLHCYDCDARIDRGQTTCDCKQNEFRLEGSEAACRYRSVSSHTGLQYTSQRFNGLESCRLTDDQPLCLFCEEERLNKLLCEKDMVLRTRDTLAASGQPYVMDENNVKQNGGPTKMLTNGYCREALAVFGADNIDLLSPLIALEHNDAFPIVKSYLNHIIQSFKLIEDLQRPNYTLVFTLPSVVGSRVTESLLQFFFEDVHVSRLCLLPKALAIAQLFERDTCIVVDSGATMTSVSVVLEGRVDVERTQTIDVGGWHLSEFLKQAMSLKESADGPTATVSSLDTTDVKEKCRLSLNLIREETRASFHRPETFRVKSQSRLRRGGVHSSMSWSAVKSEYSEIQLSSELYLAPEMMYSSLDLPDMIAKATQDLPHTFVKDCFSNILVTGGNTDLQGFNARLSSDLRDKLPEQSNLINITSYPTGNHSWNTAMGANMIQVPRPYQDILSLHAAGSPLWISREEYVLFGNHQLAQNSGPVEEL